MMKVKVRWTGRCPRHPRYKPENGRGAIRGGCQTCYRLWLIHSAAVELQRRLVDFDHQEGAEPMVDAGGRCG